MSRSGRRERTPLTRGPLADELEDVRDRSDLTVAPGDFLGGSLLGGLVAHYETIGSFAHLGQKPGLLVLISCDDPLGGSPKP
jgi:hypothetical protein